MSERYDELPDALTMDPDDEDEVPADCLEDLEEIEISTDVEDDDG